MPDPIKACRDADERDGARLAAGDYGDRCIAGTGHIDDVADSLQDFVQVAQRQLVAERARRPPAEVLSVHDVRPDTLDLGNYVASSGQPRGHDQHNRGAADDDADGAEQRSDLVRKESADGRLQCLSARAPPPVAKRRAHVTPA